MRFALVDLLDWQTEQTSALKGLDLLAGTMFKGLLDTHDSHSPRVKLFAAFAAEFVVNIIFR